MVFQDFRLLDHLSAFDNVALPLRIAGAKPNNYAQDVEELLAWVGLGDRMQARPPTLSGGEQQRVAIARAVVARPDLLIADEPTGNVDPEIGDRLIRLFGELNRLGTTVLIATHDRALIEKHPRARDAPRRWPPRRASRHAPMSGSIRTAQRILPREKGAAPLDVVIGVMAFLAALALGASLLADRAAEGWRAGLSDRLTVQIMPAEHGDVQGRDAERDRCGARRAARDARHRACERADRRGDGGAGRAVARQDAAHSRSAACRA